MRSVNGPVPVVIITAKPSENSEAFYLERGAIGFFRKPVDRDALVDLLEFDLLDMVCQIYRPGRARKREFTTAPKSH